jgi:hypothetical protein
VKKLCKGDGGRCQRKEILGWMLDTAWGTIELTPCRCLCVLDIFDYLRHQSRVNIKKWQRILGELPFMVPAVPCSAGLFGALQLGLSDADRHQVRITSHLQDHLVDFEMLACSTPLGLRKLCPITPQPLGLWMQPMQGWAVLCLPWGTPPLCGKPPSHRTSKHTSSRPQTVPGTSLTATSNRLGCWARLTL